MSRKGISHTAIVAAFVLWGTSGPFVRIISASAETFVFANAIIGLITLLPLFFLTGQYRELAGLRNLAIAISAGFLYPITSFLFYTALKLTTITNALLSHYTMPMFVIALAPLLLPEKRRRAVMLALPVAFAGLAIILPTEDLSLGNTHLAGIAFGVASAVMFALAMIWVRRLCSSFSPLTIAVAAFTATVVGLGPYVLLQEANVQSLAQAAPLFLVKGIMNATVPWVLYVSSLRVIEAQRVSIIGFFEPLTGIAIAALLLGESLTAQTLIGGLLILGAGYWVIRRGGETAKVALEQGEPR